MKILITNKQESLSNNVNVLSIISTEMNTSNKIYILDRKEIGIIKYSDTEEIFLIKDIASKFQDSNQEILIEIKDTDLEGLASSSEPVDSRPYKVYTALLTQSGTDAPVATVLENTLGGEVVWSRNVVGDYTLSLTGAFVDGKTYAPNITDISKDFYAYFNINLNYINLLTYNFTTNTADDDILINTPIEIRVYN